LTLGHQIDPVAGGDRKGKLLKKVLETLLKRPPRAFKKGVRVFELTEKLFAEVVIQRGYG